MPECFIPYPGFYAFPISYIPPRFDIVRSDMYPSYFQTADTPSRSHQGRRREREKGSEAQVAETVLAHSSALKNGRANPLLLRRANPLPPLSFCLPTSSHQKKNLDLKLPPVALPPIVVVFRGGRETGAVVPSSSLSRHSPPPLFPFRKTPPPLLPIGTAVSRR